MKAFLGALAHQAARRGGLHVFQVLGRELRPAAPGIECKRLLDSEVLSCCEDPELDLSAATAGAALARGDACVGVVSGGELAGYAWYAYGPAPHLDGVWICPPPHAIYRYKAFVRAAFRGRGVATSLYRGGDALVAKAGRRYVVNCVAMQNAPSIAASRRSGDLPLGLVAYWQKGRRFLALHSPRVGAFGLRFSLR